MRDALGMSLRDVVEASQTIAREKKKPDYALSLSALSDIERYGRVPHVYRMATLARIYKRPMAELLRLYDVVP